jgi:23S rRNA pseudouridine1911/1915/1917 synthase
MAYIQHPVVGDPLYGRRRLKEDLGLERQFLHSYSLAFDHPVTGERIALTGSMPSDLVDALTSIADRSDGRTPAGDEVVPLVMGASAEIIA